jgi:hypothetical protein
MAADGDQECEHSAQHEYRPAPPVAHFDLVGDPDATPEPLRR